MQKEDWNHDLASSVPPLPDANRYSMTVGEASALMQGERCKFSSARKVQRLCREGIVDCQKLTYSREGQPVTEWLVNETSLLERIEKHEVKLDDGAELKVGGANTSYVASSSESPFEAGVATETPIGTGDARSIPQDEKEPEETAADMATPDDFGDANYVDPSKAELMIENAKLTAELEGNRALVAEILDDKSFLREELRNAREGRKDVTKIAERMLEALETMALGGKLERLPNQQREPAVSPTQPAQSSPHQEQQPQAQQKTIVPGTPSPQPAAHPVHTQPLKEDDFRI